MIAGHKSLGADVEGIFTHLQRLMRQMIVNSSVQLTFFTDLVNAWWTVLAWYTLALRQASMACETVFNAVRLGVVIYGLNPSGSVLDLPCRIRLL